MTMRALHDLVALARAGDLDAFGQIIGRTQAMAYAVAIGVVREPALAEDAVQDAYVTAHRRLGDLIEPAAFLSWFRRVVITTALNARRSRRRTWLRLDDVAEPPVLDEEESSWTEAQRSRLAGALLSLTDEDRRLCDRRYHGGWTIARLASAAGVDEAAMRKRLQRVRDRLRREIEMSEQRELGPEVVRPGLPAKIVELLARPRLTDLPENPVGQVSARLRGCFAEFDEHDVPELVDCAAARRTFGDDPLSIDVEALHRVDDGRILRYDLTLPLLMSLRFEGRPLRAWATGKVYRARRLDPTHLEAFHQAEVFWLDERERVDPWAFAGRVLSALHVVVPGRAVKIVATQHAICRKAWDIAIEEDGRWSEVLGFGLFTDAIVRALGADPGRHAAIGLGCGLERLAMLRYGIDDIRKVEAARVG